MGMPHLVRALVADRPDTPVYYLTGLPMGFARPVRKTLQQDGYPSGTALMASGRLRPWALLGRRWVFKRAVLDRLLEIRPELRWVLIGDDGDEDPALFLDLARRVPDRVAAIGLRRVRLLAGDNPDAAGPVSVVSAPNAEELLPRLRASVGLEQPRGSTLQSWLLTAPRARQRRDAAAAVDRGQRRARARARQRATSRSWPRLSPPPDQATRCRSVAGAATPTSGSGRPGPTVGEALAAAPRSAARVVRGLLWRSHPGQRCGYSPSANRSSQRVSASRAAGAARPAGPRRSAATTRSSSSSGTRQRPGRRRRIRRRDRPGGRSPGRRPAPRRPAARHRS